MATIRLLRIFGGVGVQSGQTDGGFIFAFFNDKFDHTIMRFGFGAHALDRLHTPTFNCQQRFEI